MASVLLGLQYFSIVLMLLESGYVFCRWKTKLQGYLFFNCIATLVNNVGYLMELLANSDVEYYHAVQVSYLGRIWISYSLFLFVMHLCDVKIDSTVLVGLGAFHGMLYFAVLTNGWHGLYYTSHTYVTTGLFPHGVYSGGLLHTVYFLLMAGYIVIGIWKLIESLIREKSSYYRTRYWVVLLSVGIESIFFFIEVLHLVDGYDVTILGYTFGSLIMYIAIVRFDLMDMLQLARDYVVDELADGIIAVNDKDDVEYYNTPALDIFPFLETDSDAILEKIRKRIAEGKNFVYHERIYVPQEKILDHHGSVQGKIYCLKDDTEHLYYTEELKKQKEIAESANASKSALLSVVSHEIRTPMNAVVGMTELLLRDEASLTEKQKNYLVNIRNSGTALVQLVNDLLDQSKMEAGKMALVDGIYDLKSIIEDVSMIIENRIASNPIELQTDIDARVPELLVGDSLRIRQILINLMNNSVKFTEQGYIRLSVSVEEEKSNEVSLRFSVSDTGQGIKKEDLKKLGEAFAQVDVQKNHSKEGTGLGLSISKNFISLMGGKLEVSSKYGEGSEFYFTIKQKIGHNAAATELSSDSDEDSAKICSSSSVPDFVCPKAKLLIVDDTELNLMVASELLEVLELEIETAISGEVALEKLQNHSFDIVFMDYIMSGMNGVETTQKIREMGYDMPVVALTGDMSPETVERFRTAGINDFMEKPVSLRRMSEVLYQWLPQELIELKDSSVESV